MTKEQLALLEVGDTVRRYRNPTYFSRQKRRRK